MSIRKFHYTFRNRKAELLHHIKSLRDAQGTSLQVKKPLLSSGLIKQRNSAQLKNMWQKWD